MKLSESEMDLLRSLDQEKWDKLAQKKIYFGHQSVGYNIIDGMKDIIEKVTMIRLDVKKVGEQIDVRKNGFYHFEVGNNTDPVSKIDDFKKRVEAGNADKADILFFKFCYVDIGANSDVNDIFRKYSSVMDYLAAKYPQKIFLYFTVPLTSIPKGPKAIISKLLWKVSTSENENVKRNDFNRLVKERYKGRVFDLAKYESLCPNGNVAGFTGKNKTTCPALCDEYTDDGGHLKPGARIIIAAQFLKFLAENQ